MGERLDGREAEPDRHLHLECERERHGASNFSWSSRKDASSIKKCCTEIVAYNGSGEPGGGDSKSSDPSRGVLPAGDDITVEKRVSVSENLTENC